MKNRDLLTKEAEHAISIPLPVVVGFILWLVSFVFYLPFSPFAQEQVYVLLTAAPLFLLPLCLHLSGWPQKRLWWVVLAASIFSLAYQLEVGIISMMLVLPWLVLALSATMRFGQSRLDISVEGLTGMAAHIFWVVAAVWAVPDRLGYSPWDYDPVIILLTVVHFHYAGFLLLHLFIFALPRWPRWVGKWLAGVLLVGMPLVAIGITATQVGLPQIVESLAVTVMAAGGGGVAIGYLYLGWVQRVKLRGLLWFLSGICLLGGMCLALLYGWRCHHEWGWLSIPWMYAVHGSLNAIGFALPGLLGWVFQRGGV